MSDKGNIVNENDAIVGNYFRVTGTWYIANIYGNRYELSYVQLTNKLDTKGLYMEPVLD